MTTPNRTLDSLTTEVFALISTAQRNGMTSSDAIDVGVKPFLSRLLELEADNARLIKQPTITAVQAK